MRNIYEIRSYTHSAHLLDPSTFSTGPLFTVRDLFPVSARRVWPAVEEQLPGAIVPTNVATMRVTPNDAEGCTKGGR